MSDKPTVTEALSAVMDDVRAVKKGDRNTQQGYQFRGVDAVVNASGPAFRKHGVVVVPILEEVNYRDVQTSTGKASRECTVKVRYRFHGPAGDFIDCVTPGESMDFGDKGAPKAMSVAFRIALIQALCLPTDEPDPDSESYERSADMPAQRRPERAPDGVREVIVEALAAKKPETLRDIWSKVGDEGLNLNVRPYLSAEVIGWTAPQPNGVVHLRDLLNACAARLKPPPQQADASTAGQEWPEPAQVGGAR